MTCILPNVDCLENSDIATFLSCSTGRLVSFSISRNFLVHWNLSDQNSYAGLRYPVSLRLLFGIEDVWTTPPRVARCGCGGGAGTGTSVASPGPCMGGTQIPTSSINEVKPSVQIIDIEDGELRKTNNNNVAETGKI